MEDGVDFAAEIMMEIHCLIEILKPPECIFPWIAEPEKAMQWQKSVKSGEIIINKPEIIGTTFKEEIEEKGKRLVMSGEITDHQKNRKIQFHLKSKIHELDVSYTLFKKNGSTQLTMDAIIHWRFPMNIMCLIMGKRIKTGILRQMESELLDLKQKCEL